MFKKILIRLLSLIIVSVGLTAYRLFQILDEWYYIIPAFLFIALVIFHPLFDYWEKKCLLWFGDSEETEEE